MKRAFQFAGLLALSWIVMTSSHELGHVIGGWLSGATLTALDLLPWHLPYSIHQPDPHPLVTLWSGPLLGCLLPIGIAALVRHDWLWFIADFCLLSNGLYLFVGWFSGDQYLDTTRLIESGTSAFAISTFCLLTISIGYIRFRRDCISVLSPR